MAITALPNFRPPTQRKAPGPVPMPSGGRSGVEGTKGNFWDALTPSNPSGGSQPAQKPVMYTPPPAGQQPQAPVQQPPVYNAIAKLPTYGGFGMPSPSMPVGQSPAKKPVYGSGDQSDPQQDWLNAMRSNKDISNWGGLQKYPSQDWEDWGRQNKLDINQFNQLFRTAAPNLTTGDWLSDPATLAAYNEMQNPTPATSQLPGGTGGGTSFTLPDLNSLLGGGIFGNSSSSTQQQTSTTSGSNPTGVPLPAFKPLNVSRLNAASDADAEMTRAAMDRNTRNAFGDAGFRTKGAGYSSEMNRNLAQTLGQREQGRLQNETAAATMQNQFGPAFSAALSDLMRINNEKSGQGLSFLAQLLNQMSSFAQS